MPQRPYHRSLTGLELRQCRTADSRLDDWRRRCTPVELTLYVTICTLTAEPNSMAAIPISVPDRSKDRSSAWLPGTQRSAARGTLSDVVREGR